MSWRYPLGTKNASPYIPVQLKLQVGAKDASLHSPSEAHREGNAEPKAGMDERPTTGKGAGSEDGRKDDGIHDIRPIRLRGVTRAAGRQSCCAFRTLGRGNCVVSTVTLKAFSEDEVDKMVQELP